jgi:hypothetical protein
MAQSDPLDRAFTDLEAVMLAQFQLDPGEGSVRREIHDRPLQRPRTPARTDLRAENKGPHAVVSEPVLWLYDRDIAEFRMPAEFFLPWRCIYPDSPGIRRNLLPTSSGATLVSA